jgi:pilus assembly protein Flp/PilA
MMREEGQDLVEYALLMALVAATATASTSGLAIVLTTAMTNLGNELTNIISGH